MCHVKEGDTARRWMDEIYNNMDVFYPKLLLSAEKQGAGVKCYKHVSSVFSEPIPVPSFTRVPERSGGRGSTATRRRQRRLRECGWFIWSLLHLFYFSNNDDEWSRNLDGEVV